MKSSFQAYQEAQRKREQRRRFVLLLIAATAIVVAAWAFTSAFFLAFGR